MHILGFGSSPAGVPKSFSNGSARPRAAKSDATMSERRGAILAAVESMI